MPIRRCGPGRRGYKYGGRGKCYPTRKQAVRQMRAMFANGYRPKKNG